MVGPTDLIKVFPTYTHYTGGGKHCVLQWSDTRHSKRVILAKSEKSCEVVFRRIVECYTNVTVLDYRWVEVVKPTQEAQVTWARYCLERFSDIFWHQVSLDVKAHLELGNDLPRDLIPCKGHSEGEVTPRRGHHNCTNCGYGYLPSEGTLEEVYLAKRHLTRDALESGGTPKGIPGGRQAIPGEALRLAFISRGSDGLSLTEGVEADDLWEAWNKLFFFIPGEPLPRVNLRAISNQVLAAQAQANEAQNLKRKEQQRMEDILKSNRLLRLFPEKDEAKV